MGPDDQSWLFREGDLILGPVPPKQIVDKLYKGELSAASEIQLMGSGQFMKLSDVPDFKVHLAKAQAQARVHADDLAHKADQKKKLIRIVSILSGVLVVIGIGVAVLGQYLAVHSSTKSAEELAWGDITIDAPVISRAKRTTDEELVDYQAGTGKKTPGTPTAAANPGAPGKTPPGPGKTPGTTPGAVASAGTNKNEPKQGKADEEGMSMGEIDQDGINLVIARNKPTLIPCLQAVAKPGLKAKIPIEFAIGEGGKVGKVWVDNPDFKNGPLTECLLEKMQKWPFTPKQAGATISLAFNIGGRG
jgi:hypothetical protein